MIGQLLVLSLGLTDLALAVRAPWRWVLLAAAWAAVAVLAIPGLGIAWYVVPVVIALSALWALAMRGDDIAAPRRIWPVIAVAVLVAVVTLVDATTARGFVVDAYAAIPLAALDGVDVRTAFAAVAVAVFLTRSANLAARAALGADTPRAAATAPREAWELRLGRMLVGTVNRPKSAPPAEPQLRGGRIIGPIERLLIVALALGGAQAIIAALLAAKGIVRFPEISADRGTGSKAEEFLVGSLTSWSISAAAVLYLHVLHAG